MRISILDYGIGNLRSVNNALRAIGVDGQVTRDTTLLNDSAGLIVPGVGAFGHCVGNLKEMHLIEEIFRFVQSGRPMLGICVGMQMLFERSTEFGMNEGLGLVPGFVDRIDTVRNVSRLPHISWANVSVNEAVAPKMFEGIDDRRFYFVHSYTAIGVPSEFIAGVSDYEGQSVIAAVRKDNVWGTQFHPEKSAGSGLRLLTNFAAQC